MKLTGWRIWTVVVFLGILAGAVCGRVEAAPERKNKIIIYPAANESVSQLKQRGIKKIDDYGSYWLVEASDEQLASLKQSHGDRAVKANYLNRIELAAVALDTTEGEPALPAHLKEVPGIGKRLRLVQFKGPVLPEWLDQLNAAGKVKIVTYIPNNAYLVWLDEKSEQNLKGFVDPNGPIQWIGKYHPYYKLKRVQKIKTATVDVRVAILNDVQTEQTVGTIQLLSLKPVQSRQAVLGQTVITVTVRTADLPVIAQMPDVLWIEPVVRARAMDEKQALILANRTGGPGNGPIAGEDSYIDFLDSLGFSTRPEAYPIVDVADSGLDMPFPFSVCNANIDSRFPWHPTFYTVPAPVSPIAQCCSILGESRVAYNFMPPDTDGHGTLVASILAGFDTLPNEVINCFTERNTTRVTTNLFCLLPDGTTIGPVASCSLDVCAGFVECLTNITSTTVCEIVTNRPSPPFPAELFRRDDDGFQTSLGVSPFGRIGASPGGAEASFPGPELAISRVYLSRARISNNSWGERLLIGVNDGAYGALSQSYDALVRDAVPTGSTNPPTPGPSPLNQEMIIVFAGGNSNGESPVGGFGDVLPTPPATAKNVISVGASENVRPDCPIFSSDADNSFDISFFNSFGPTEDGRFKPEIVAPGSAILGARSQAAYSHPQCGGCDPNNPFPAACTNDFFLVDTFIQFTPVEARICHTLSGTSFSAPAVSGGLQLLWWWFQNRLTNELGQALLQPSPAMAKAYLCNSARYLPITNPQTGVRDTLPSIAQGMGIMNLERMFDGVPRIIRDQSTPRAIDPPLITTNPAPQQTYFSSSGQSYELSGRISSNNLPFRVTLAWVDAPGSPAAFQQLVNDLDLEVTVGGQTYKGNVFAEDRSVVGGGFDGLNNMESVFLPAGGAVTSGAPYSVVVRAANIAADGVPNVGSDLDQDFALVVYNAQNPSDVPNLATNDACQTAKLISSFPFVWTNTLSTAAYRNVHPSPSVGRGGVEEFFRIINPTPGTVFSADTFGSGFDTVLSVWKGECGALVEVTSSDNASNTLQSAVNWAVSDTNTYYIVVEGRRNATGTVVLNVTTPGPQITFDPAALDFGGQFVGTTSAVQTVTLLNGTPNRLNVSSVTITGTDASDFHVLTEACSDSPIPPGGFCQIAVNFAPSATGPRSAVLRITDDATGSPRSVPLSGTGLAPAPLVCLSADSLSFENQLVGSTSAVRTVVITNCGAAALFITNIVVTGTASADFILSSDTCSASSIAPGATCSIGLRFAPKATGLRVAALRISNNAAGSPHTVSLAGLGISCPPITVLPQLLPNAALGEPYSQSLTGSGGTAPFTFLRTSGSLPPGLSLSSGGTISGTPTFLGSFTFKLNVIDANNCTGERFYTIKVVCPTITLSPATLPTGELGQPYSVTFSATGGRAPHTFAQTGGSLPAGLTLSSAGVLSGIPTSGSSVFTVTATDADGCSTSVTYLLTLGGNCPAISVSPSSLPGGTVGSAYSQTLSGSGGVGPYTFSLATGTLPPGLALSVEGTISGTPTTAGDFTFTVRAADAFGCMGIRTYTVRICPAITVSPATLPPGTRGAPYAQTLTASGGTAPHSFAVTGGALPAGLTLSGAGTLSGTPTVEGAFGFTVTATDAEGCAGSRLYSLIINPSADLAVEKSGSPDTVIVGSNITYTITVTNLGPSTATGVTATDTLPAATSFVSASSGCVATGGVVSCALGSLAVGGSTNATIVVTATGPGLLTNTVSVSGAQTDLVAANNMASVVTTAVVAALEFSAPSLFVTAGAGNGSLSVTRIGPASEPVSVDYATEDGTAVAGVDYAAVAGTLHFDSGAVTKNITIPVLNGGAVGSRTVNVRLSNPAGGAALGARSRAVMTIVNNAKGQRIALTDSDGDQVTVQLRGPGSLEVSLAGNDHGPIERILLVGTEASSSLGITIRRGPQGDGLVDVGGIAGSGALGSIRAGKVNLVGSGIELGGHLGSVLVRDIVNGAGVSTGGSAAQQTQIKAHVVGDGTMIRVGSVIKTITAARVGLGEIIAPCVQRVSVTGNARLGIRAEFRARVTTDAGCSTRLP